MLDEKIYTTEQVASILQVHPFTILKFLKAGKLKGIKLGRVYRITEADVKSFLEERMTKESFPRPATKRESSPEQKPEQGSNQAPKVPSPSQQVPAQKKNDTFQIEKSGPGKDPNHYYII